MITKFIPGWKAAAGRARVVTLALLTISGCASMDADDDEIDPTSEATPNQATAPRPPNAFPEAPSVDVSNLTFGSDANMYAIGLGDSTGGNLFMWLPGNGAVIYGLQVRSRNFVDAVQFAYYRPSQPDNLYRGEPVQFTQVVGANAGDWQTPFYCPAGTALSGISGFTESGRIRNMQLACSRVDVSSGVVAWSPSWGSNSISAEAGGRLCRTNELFTSMHVRTDSSSLLGLQGVCRLKR